MQRGDVVVTKIASADNLADPFTKSSPCKTRENSHFLKKGKIIISAKNLEFF